MKKKTIYRESPEARKERVRTEGNRFHTRVVKSKKQYDRQKFKKGENNEWEPFPNPPLPYGDIS